LSEDKNIDTRIPNWKKIIYFFSHAVFIFMLGTCFIFAHDMVTKSNDFSIRQINIKGNNHLNNEEICKIAGINVNDNIFNINISILRAKLENNLWIKKAKVKRILPDTVEIDINEEIPCAKINFKDTYILNFQGNLFKKYEKKDALFDIPEITGLNYIDLSKKNYFFCLAIDIAKQKNFFKKKNFTIHLDKDMGITLFNAGDFNEIIIGFNEFEGIIKNLNLVKYYINQKFNDIKIEKIDLSNKNRVILKPFPAMG